MTFWDLCSKRGLCSFRSRTKSSFSGEKVSKVLWRIFRASTVIQRRLHSLWARSSSNFYQYHHIFRTLKIFHQHLPWIFKLSGMFKLRLWIFQQIHAVTVPNILFIKCFTFTSRKSNHTTFQTTQGEVESLGGDPKRLEGVEGGIPR